MTLHAKVTMEEQPEAVVAVAVQIKHAKLEEAGWAAVAWRIAKGGK